MVEELLGASEGAPSARNMFRHHEAVVEYRPAKVGDAWEWYWVLMPLPDEDVAIATGSKPSRGAASLEARNEARRAGYTIKSVRVHHHSLKPNLEAPAPHSLRPF